MKKFFETGEKFVPEAGKTYTNRGGGQYRCMRSSSWPPFSGVMQNVKSGWTFDAIGCQMYADGTIEWDFSLRGKFVPLEEPA